MTAEDSTGGEPDGALRVVIAIPTFRRPRRLEQLLDSLPSHISAVGAEEVGVIVIDNDPDGSAEQVVHASPYPTMYVREDSPGIAAARDRALLESADFDLLVFIDDDEIPLDGWLRSLLETHRRYAADAVAGRVITVLPEAVDRWIIDGGFFNRPTHPTGTKLEVCASGNLLLDLRTVRRLGLRFDRELGLAGGEDTAFTRELARRGGSIVWCQESAAEDHIEPERTTRAWIRRRWFAHGNVAVAVSLRAARTKVARFRTRVRACLGGTARMAVGSIRAISGRLLRRGRAEARGMRGIYRGAGMVSAALGRRFEEYGREQSA